MPDLTDNGPFPISRHPAHLGLGATTTAEPEFTGEMQWYAAYGARHGGDGDEARLVSMHTFTESWGMWEMHPQGSELVLVTAGTLYLIQDEEGTETRLTVSAGEYVINPPGVWHTADVEAPATALFITSGVGTQHRPR